MLSIFLVFPSFNKCNTLYKLKKKNILLYECIIIDKLFIYLYKYTFFQELDSIIDRSLHNDHPFNAILTQDPVGCARKMVCTLAARRQNQLNKGEKSILNMIR